MAVDVIQLLGDQIKVLASSPETGGAVTLVEVTAPPGGGPPLHTHAQVEVFVCLEGEIEMRFEDEVVTLVSGEALTVPSGAPHTYHNASAAAAKMHVAITPGGIETFFAELAAATGEGPPDMALVTEIATRHGIAFVGAPPAP